jgi:hypothetical protein
LTDSSCPNNRRRPEAVQALLVAAAEGEVRFDHAAQHLRDTRDLHVTLAQAQPSHACLITVIRHARIGVFSDWRGGIGIGGSLAWA